MRTVGIIGGLGPETTAKFYLEVVFSCFEKDTINRPPMLIWNVPLSYKVEEDFITKVTGEEKYIPYLIDAAKRLEKGGADFIVIPCNSVHIFIDEVRTAVKIPVLSIIEETTKFLMNERITEVGILATSATISKKLYEDPLSRRDIKIIKPLDEDQIRMGSIVNKLVHSRHDLEDKLEIQEILHKFIDNGVTNVILACTDLQLLITKAPNIEIFDTMEILAQATVREILK